MNTWKVLAHAVLLVMASLSLAAAEDSTVPLVEVELTETDVIPGQPTVLRVTVLVPTWLPKPVSFPTFEVPDLLVKLPERSTSPVSRTIDGETWSGVTRGYRISPMVPGTINIPEQELTIFWAEPGKTDPLVTKSTIPSVTLQGVVPDGAEDLDPFIAANDLSLTETLSSDARILKPGDSLVREVVLKVDGTSPLFLPQLLPMHDLQGVASYKDEPEVVEKSNRSWISGTRTESVTLVAESGGSGSVPAIEIKWYNLESNSIETARIDGFDLTVDAPVARSGPEIDPRVLAGLAATAALLLYLMFRLLRWGVPLLRARKDARKRAYGATENWAYTQVQNAVKNQSYDDLMPALATWRSRLSPPQKRDDEDLTAALAEIGQSLFGPSKTCAGTSNTGRAWSELSAVTATYRSRCISTETQRRQEGQLAPLNPA